MHLAKARPSHKDEHKAILLNYCTWSRFCGFPVPERPASNCYFPFHLMSTWSDVRTSYTSNVSDVVRFHVLWHCLSSHTGTFHGILLKSQGRKYLHHRLQKTSCLAVLGSALTVKLEKKKNKKPPLRAGTWKFHLWLNANWPETERVNAIMQCFLARHSGSSIKSSMQIWQWTLQITDCIYSKCLAKKYKYHNFPLFLPETASKYLARRSQGKSECVC